MKVTSSRARATEASVGYGDDEPLQGDPAAVGGSACGRDSGRNQREDVPVGVPLSFRVQGEVLEYVANSRGIYGGDDEENLKAALDLQVMQRVFTKITGTESVRPLLEELQKYFKGWLPLSDEKVRSILIEL